MKIKKKLNKVIFYTWVGILALPSLPMAVLGILLTPVGMFIEIFFDGYKEGKKMLRGFTRNLQKRAEQ